MSDESEVGSESGMYRSVKVYLFPALVFILWAIGAFLCVAVWNDVRDLGRRVTTLEAQQVNDQRSFDNLSTSIKEIQADIKELLREVRK